MKINVINQAGESVKEITINDNVFAAKINHPAMHTMVVNYLANCRQGTQSTLTRTEVRGGGRKPWRQKGTGRARQGSIRAPQWKGGGVALGPKPRSYSFSVNKNLRRVAMKSAFSLKVKDAQLIVIDNLDLKEIKTKQVVSILQSANLAAKTLILTAEKNENLVTSASNVPKIRTAVVGSINVYDILNHDNLLVTEDAIRKIEEVYA